jgi:hypothetical protein
VVQGFRFGTKGARGSPDLVDSDSAFGGNGDGGEVVLQRSVGVTSCTERLQ